MNTKNYPQFLIEDKEEQIKMHFFFENNEENFNLNEKRSKTFGVPKKSVKCKNKSRPHPKVSNININPLKLSAKTHE